MVEEPVDHPHRRALRDRPGRRSATGHDRLPELQRLFHPCAQGRCAPRRRRHGRVTADGTVSQIGTIRGQSLLQAKGHEFNLLALLSGDRHKAAVFQDGSFATVYLSPQDYHRVHIPLAGTLESMVFVPGALFSVSAATTQLIPGLFARNERVICHFQTNLGPMAVVLVGAIFVGSMETVWHGEVRGQRGQATRWVYRGDERRRFHAGDEIGRFNMGSTVIVLLPQRTAAWEPNIGPGSEVRMGQAIGRPLPHA